ncbi:transcriptional regulator [Corynebacterium sp. HMSC072D01]|nr:transcriptional regulator [Corynebacterium sp. HMSC072D01]
MPIMFKPVSKLLINRDMTREDLRIATGLSAATTAKMSQDGNATAEVLARICTALSIDINDICEATKERK